MTIICRPYAPTILSLSLCFYFCCNNRIVLNFNIQQLATCGDIILSLVTLLRILPFKMHSSFEKFIYHSFLMLLIDNLKREIRDFNLIEYLAKLQHK